VFLKNSRDTATFVTNSFAPIISLILYIGAKRMSLRLTPEIDLYSYGSIEADRYDEPPKEKRMLSWQWLVYVSSCAQYFYLISLSQRRYE
jgi:hypothetical protein